MHEEKIDIAGLKVNTYTKQEFLAALADSLGKKDKIFITTLYSEFLLAAMRDSDTKTMLNRADFALADGIAIPWSQTFLSIPLTSKPYYARIIQSFIQLCISGAGILIAPGYVKKIIPETIVGADLIWDLAAIANQKSYTVYLLGGFGDTPQLTAKKLKEKLPNLNIVGISNKGARDASIIEDINQAKPDFLFIAFGPIKQEQWISNYLPQLPVKLAIGLGGTFDYLAGVKKQPPQFIRKMGLEWLYRLITQPYRFKRIWNATWNLCKALLRYKVFSSYPFRQNALCVVFNSKGEILIGQRNPSVRDLADQKDNKKFRNYWQFPQGGLNDGEDIIKGAERELREETGVTSAVYITTSDHRPTYEWPNAARPLLDPFYSYYKAKGQEQLIVYFQFTGPESEIILDNQEFIAYRWCPISELLTTVHLERQPIANIILQDLRENPNLKKVSDTFS